MLSKQKLLAGETLSVDDFYELILNKDALKDEFKQKAKEKTEQVFGNKVYIRALLEVSNVCKNDCFYCGIRNSNKNAVRYALSENEILDSLKVAYSLGFKTFVLQGGENDFDYAPIVRKIRSLYPEVAITLSLGEKTYEEYKRLKEAGADRYLLRHETKGEEHYKKLHPESMSLENRLKCLRDLKSLGYQTGCGFMVGSPFQTIKDIAQDLKFIQDFKPDMVGIGPFMPQKDTPFKDFMAGSVEDTLYLISILRLINNKLLIPATTALGSAKEGGREQGILCGANVVMPNISPLSAREHYTLYDNKLSSGAEAKEGLLLLQKSLEKIGRTISFERGDAIR